MRTISYGGDEGFPSDARDFRRTIMFDVVRSPWMIVVRCNWASTAPIDDIRFSADNERAAGGESFRASLAFRHAKLPESFHSLAILFLRGCRSGTRCRRLVQAFLVWVPFLLFLLHDLRILSTCASTQHISHAPAVNLLHAQRALGGVDPKHTRDDNAGTGTSRERPRLERQPSARQRLVESWMAILLREAVLQNDGLSSCRRL